ncbi:hypothetical protein ACVDFE_00125 [Lentzea chajnantorensis]
MVSGEGFAAQTPTPRQQRRRAKEMQANTPKIEIAGHRDADTGEIDLVVYVDGEQQNVLWNIFDGTRWANFSTCLRDEEDRVPRSAWRGAVREVASQGSVAFASMISAYSEIDEETLTYDDMHPSANVQRDAATVEDLDPELWFEAANASTGTTGFSAAYGVVALRAFRTCAAESEREKVEAALSAYRAATRYFRASLANTLQGLFADLRHFADSREAPDRGAAAPHRRHRVRDRRAAVRAEGVRDHRVGGGTDRGEGRAVAVRPGKGCVRRASERRVPQVRRGSRL